MAKPVIIYVDVWREPDGWHHRMRYTGDVPDKKPTGSPEEIIATYRSMGQKLAQARLVRLNARPDDADPDD